MIPAGTSGSSSANKIIMGRIGAVSALILFLSALQAPTARASSMGICWGRVSNQPMPPVLTVKMLQANNVTSVKLYNADPKPLVALGGTGIEIMIMVSNQEIQGIATSILKAQQWIQQNVLAFLPDDVNIKYISVGNEPFLTVKASHDAFVSMAVENMYQALVTAKLEDRVKLTVSFNSQILANSSPPSAGAFKPRYLDQIVNISNIIHKTNSVFSINIYPFFELNPVPDQKKRLDKNHVFFDQVRFFFKDNGLTYTNVFDATLDAIFAAFQAAKLPQNISLIIGEIGWPTDGSTVASHMLAQEFNQGAIQHLLSGGGTPLKPGLVIPGYLFSLYDEDYKSIDMGLFERFWGIYDTFGKPKYDLDLSGQNKTSVMLDSVPDVYFLPNKWCVARSGVDTDILNETLLETCDGSVNCLPILSNLTSPGLQCGAPASLQSRASYVFNEYFQNLGQNSSLCDLNKMAEVTNIDPSTVNCTYNVGLDLTRMNQFTVIKDTHLVWIVAYIGALALLLPFVV